MTEIGGRTYVPSKHIDPARIFVFLPDLPFSVPIEKHASAFCGFRPVSDSSPAGRRTGSHLMGGMGLCGVRVPPGLCEAPYAGPAAKLTAMESVMAKKPGNALATNDEVLDPPPAPFRPYVGNDDGWIDVAVQASHLMRRNAALLDNLVTLPPIPDANNKTRDPQVLFAEVLGTPRVA